MKKYFILVFILGGFTLAAQAQTQPTNSAPSAITTANKPATPKKQNKKTASVMYECPMKCEKPSAKSGACAKCGMDKVAIK